MPQEALLSAIEWLLVNQEHRFHDFAVRWLHAILCIKVERVYDTLLAGGLNDVSRPKSPAPGEVVLHGNAVPVVDFQADKKRIVVTMPQTSIREDVVRDLP